MEDSAKPFFERPNAIVFLLVVFLAHFARDLLLGHYQHPFCDEIVSYPVDAFLETLGEFGHFIVIGESSTKVKQDRVFRHGGSPIMNSLG